MKVSLYIILSLLHGPKPSLAPVTLLESFCNLSSLHESILVACSQAELDPGHSCTTWSQVSPYKKSLQYPTRCQSSFTLWTIHSATCFCNYVPQNHLDSKTIWVTYYFDFLYTLYIIDFSKPIYPTILYWRLFSSVRIKISSSINHLPSSILGFITGLSKSGIYCQPKISMPRVSNLPRAFIILWHIWGSF